MGKENLWLREEVDRLRNEKITFHNKINDLNHISDDSPEIMISGHAKRINIDSFVEKNNNANKIRDDYKKLTQSAKDCVTFDEDQVEEPRREPKQFNSMIEHNVASESPIEYDFLAKDCFKKDHSKSRSRSKLLTNRSISRNYQARSRCGSNSRSEDINNIEKVVLDTHSKELNKLYQNVKQDINVINTSINFAIGGVRTTKTEPNEQSPLLTEKTFELGTRPNYSPRRYHSPLLTATTQKKPVVRISYPAIPTQSPRQQDYSPPPMQRNPYSSETNFNLHPHTRNENLLNTANNYSSNFCSLQNSHSFQQENNENIKSHHLAFQNNIKSNYSVSSRKGSGSPDRREFHSQPINEFHPHPQNEFHKPQNEFHKPKNDSKSGFKLIQDSMDRKADKFVINESKLIQEKLKKELESFRSKAPKDNSSMDYDSLSKPEKVSNCSYSEGTNNFNTLLSDSRYESSEQTSFIQDNVNLCTTLEDTPRSVRRHFEDEFNLMETEIRTRVTNRRTNR